MLVMQNNRLVDFPCVGGSGWQLPSPSILQLNNGWTDWGNECTLPTLECVCGGQGAKGAHSSPNNTSLSAYPPPTYSIQNTPKKQWNLYTCLVKLHNGASGNAHDKGTKVYSWVLHGCVVDEVYGEEVTTMNKCHSSVVYLCQPLQPQY